MATIEELARPHPIQVLPETPVFEAARQMANFGVGDVIVTDPETGVVIGILTDRDLAVRVVAPCLDPALTSVGDVCTEGVTTIIATEDIVAAEELMRREGIHRLPIVNRDGTLAGIISTVDLAGSAHVADDELRGLIRSLGDAPRDNRRMT